MLTGRCCYAENRVKDSLSGRRRYYYIDKEDDCVYAGNSDIVSCRTGLWYLAVPDASVR